jgi:DNA processing protein
MKSKKLTLKDPGFPQALRQIATPPDTLFVAGRELIDLLDRPKVAIVGSRKVSTYGKEVTYRFARYLAEQGITIISGLALGVDSIAHRAALEAGGLTIAILPGSIERIYPSSHRQLASQIIEQGGALLSEYPAGSDIYKHNFIARNRLVSGLADALLITEAAEKSGSLHTARFALEQGKEVLAIPGNITSPNAAGTNNLLKAGALVATEPSDVLHAMGLASLTSRPVTAPQGATDDESLILAQLAAGTTDGEALLRNSGLSVEQFNQSLTMLEISGKVRSLGANQWTHR